MLLYLLVRSLSLSKEFFRVSFLLFLPSIQIPIANVLALARRCSISSSEDGENIGTGMGTQINPLPDPRPHPDLCNSPLPLPLPLSVQPPFSVLLWFSLPFPAPRPVP